MVKKLAYYNYSRLFSVNAIFNFLIGGRGLGKTFGAKEKGIKDAIRKGDEFIYLRRYSNEVKDARATFVADISWKFPKYDFRIVGSIIQCSPVNLRDMKKRDWQTIGYFVALSTAQFKKSVAYPKVKLIIFDEFIIEKGMVQYLPNEVNVFMNFFVTVDRYQDKTRVLFLANSVSIMNPYFITYKIKPVSNEIVIMKDGFIAVHFPDSTEFKKTVFETRTGKFIQDTEYADFAVGNIFADNNDALTALKNGDAIYIMSLETAQGWFSVWYSSKESRYYVQTKRPKEESLYTLEPSKMDEGKTLLTYSDDFIRNLRGAFRRGNLYFDNPNTRNTFTEIFKR